jgi:hypothetical protein
MWEERSAAYAAARGYTPDLAWMRAGLDAEQWTPLAGIDIDRFDRLGDLIAQLAPEMPGDHRGTPPQNDQRRNGDMAVTIRLRPWAADLVRRLRRRG